MYVNYLILYKSSFWAHFLCGNQFVLDFSWVDYTYKPIKALGVCHLDGPNNVYWSSFGYQSGQYLELEILVVGQVMWVSSQNDILLYSEGLVHQNMALFNICIYKYGILATLFLYTKIVIWCDTL